MPKPTLERVRNLLEIRGPSSGPMLQDALGIGQPAFSRLLGQDAGTILVSGARKNRVYAALRQVGGASEFPVYMVAADGSARRAATLHAVAPKGFYVNSRCDDFESAFHDDLPYFLYDQRPAGFLGRALPYRHPELGAPRKIQDWSGDHCLRYFVAHGWDMPGALIVGEPAYSLFMGSRRGGVHGISAEDRIRRYDEIAEDVMAGSPAGSSAGGEQPKFLQTLVPEQRAVLVKFSPAADGGAARRTKDLLICEHLALETLRDGGVDACNSELIESPKRIFLQVDRFDRLPTGGRRGVLSLSALDLQHVGTSLQQWSDPVPELVRKRLLAPELANNIRALELFGQLIANTDMHPGNLSFFAEGEQVEGLTPCYDMLPMLYAPRDGDLPARNFVPPMPRPSDAPWWESVHRMAHAFWQRAAADRRISRAFRTIADENADKVGALEGVGALLPLGG